MPHKTNSLLIFVASVAFIIIAIVVSAVITSTKENNLTDYRTRAENPGSMIFIGIAGTFDESTNQLEVTNLKFEDTQGKSLGTWNVSVPVKYRPGTITPGSQIRIIGNPATFQVATRTLTASDIKRR